MVSAGNDEYGEADVKHITGVRVPSSAQSANFTADSTSSNLDFSYGLYSYFDAVDDFAVHIFLDENEAFEMMVESGDESYLYTGYVDYYDNMFVLNLDITDEETAAMSDMFPIELEYVSSSAISMVTWNGILYEGESILLQLTNTMGEF